MAGKREEFARQVSAKDAELAEREARVTSREQNVDTRQAQVDGFPALLETRVQQAVETVRERLTTDAQSSAKLLQAAERR